MRPRNPAQYAAKSPAQGDEPILDIMRERGAPVVTTGRPLLVKHKLASVDNDNARATIKALDHLRRAGYSRPAIISSARRVSYAEDAIAAYVEWTEKHGCGASVVRLRTISVGAAESAVRKLLATRGGPDSFFVTNYDLAIGVSLAAQVLGRTIPGSVGLISLGDSPALRSVTPPISAVDIMPGRLGRESVELLLGRLAGDASPTEQRLVPTRLVARSSTMRPRD